MPDYKVNTAGVRHAEELIENGRYDTETPWSQASLSAAEETEVIEGDGYEAFARWHLAEDRDASEGTKGRFRFPFGDHERVNRAALIHAKQRASQNGHDDIEKAADRLIKRLDRAAG